jgi:cytidylate kinase
MSDTLVIALDGPAASGKGTLAKRIAAKFGLPHLDTGLLYRGVGRGVLDRGGDPGDVAAAVEVASKLDLAGLDEDRLRGAEMGEAASRVAAIPEVRVMLLDLQRRFAGQPGGAVLDGRDIGTVICPDAKVKIFVTASPEVRAERRFKELTGRGEAVSYDDVLADIKRRDERDSSRSSAPLVAAADAHLLDTTALDIDAAFRAALDIIGRR